MRDQGSLGGAVLVLIVDPLQFKTGELRLDALRDRQIGDKTAAVDRDEFSRQRRNGVGMVGHDAKALRSKPFRRSLQLEFCR
jgi:hypothetical protein